MAVYGKAAGSLEHLPRRDGRSVKVQATVITSTNTGRIDTQLSHTAGQIFQIPAVAAIYGILSHNLQSPHITLAKGAFFRFHSAYNLVKSFDI